MEEVCWLVEMAAHLIADSGDGEVPMVPNPIASVIQDPTAEEALLQLCHVMLGVPCFCLDSRLRHLASPR